MAPLTPIPLSSPPAQLGAQLGAAFEEHGFAVVSEHGIPPELIAEADKQARALFALPEPVRRSYHQPGGGGARGYTPFGAERAKGAQVHDLKEFWHIGRDLPPGDPLEPFMAPNVWPAELPAFHETFTRLFAAFDECGGQILSAIALHLGLAPDHFDASVEQGNSVLRLLHYPPVEGAAEGAVRAAPHEDINTITLLLGAEEAGLELLTRDGRWLAITPPPGALVVNIGDMLQRLTAGRLRSTTHRVVNPAGPAAQRSRYSLPFFLHFRPDFMIVPIGEGGEPPITAHDYLMQRLREINLA